MASETDMPNGGEMEVEELPTQEQGVHEIVNNVTGEFHVEPSRCH